MNPFDAPRAPVGPAARAALPMVGWARLTLLGIAAFNGLFVILIPGLYALIGVLEDDMGLAIGMFAGGVLVSAIMAVFGVVPMVAAWWGLGRGAKWAWILTVCVGGIYAPSACFPIGAFLLYAMLNDEVRQAFLD